ncbi:MAG TPA: ribbon-helix-helix protein, CopG family [Thermoanaerobaculia bacterium]|nr:ribbon-helix-helix protein, CopG family [Thermoanaerobaculia bacterium]
MVRKVTFTLDDQTVRRIDAAASRLNRPKSQIVREAVAEYHAHVGKLSESERLQKLEALDRLLPTVPIRSTKSVHREIADIRLARRAGGRRKS